MKQKFKQAFIIIVLLTIYSFLCAYSYVQAVSQDLSNSVFRLHVIANSDSDEDQNLKYIVRDNLLEYMNNLCSNCTTKEQAITLANEHKEDFKRIALNTIYDQGFNYDVNINIGQFDFPTKTYGDISLPAGYYDALRVEIGEAKGQNWWCVMFPPLCFVDISSGIVDESSKALLESELSQEDYALISDNSSTSITFKFKLLEFFANSGVITAKNS
jgi:stage II sporulation protein R